MDYEFDSFCEIFNAPSKLQEELFKEENDRLSVFPIKFPKVYEMYKTHRAMGWEVEEIDFSKDLDDWKKLSDDEKYFIKNILAFFAGSDGIVNMNLGERFCSEVKMMEAKMFYRYQMAAEDVHGETYSLMIETYVKDDEEKMKLLNGIKTIPSIKKKAEWALKWIDSDEDYAKRLVAFAIVEGVFFSGSFCSIFWLKKRNLLPGLTLSNEWIARDEGLHCEFAVLMYSMLKKKLDYKTIVEIYTDAVRIEQEFIRDSLPIELIGMNSSQMCKYIEYVADYWIVKLGYSKVFNTENPFKWMESISLQGKTNFFESRVTQYQKGIKKDEADYDFDEDF